MATLRGFLLQVLHGNTACSHVPRLLGKAVPAEAYGQARCRLPLEFFQRLLEEVCSRLTGSIDAVSSWHGHRVWVIDGSSCLMPDTPELRQAFGQPGGQAPGCGFPVAHLMTLFHVGTGAMLESAQRHQIDANRISFVDALRWLRCAGQGGSLGPIRVVPERPGRHDPRVRKRRAKNYRLMTKPRSDLMHVLAAQALSP